MIRYAALAAGFTLFATAASAGSPTEAKPSETVFIAQIVALLVTGRLLGELMQRLGQPAIMGQLLAGVLLGPSVFGALWPAGQTMLFPQTNSQPVMIDALSQLGILLLLLVTGMETDLALVRRVRRAAASVSLTGIALPFLCGFALGEFMPDSMLPKPELRIVTSLFLGTALSISSVKIVAMVVREMDFLRRDVGQIIVASSIIDDTIGWVIIAITFSLATHGHIDLVSIGKTLAGTAIFLVASFTVGRRLVSALIRTVNDRMQSEAAVITAILVVMCLMALTTQAIGVHTVLGAFVAGVLVGQSPILTRRIDEQLRGLITGLFAPVFFGLAGLHADLTVLSDPKLLAYTIALIAIASLGKFSGAFVGGAIGGLKPAQSLALAFGMNARGSTEVIVATIGLSIGALSQDLFTMIVAMAVITTLAMPPTLRWALARLPLEDKEKERLERETFEETGFVSRMERLMIAADASPKGRFAARLAGLIAGARGMPVTVVPMDDSPQPAEQIAAEIEETATATQARLKEPVDPLPDPIAVVTLAKDEAADDAIAGAAAKGFDLLVIGMEQTGSPGGGFSAVITTTVDRFDGPVAIVAARGVQASDSRTQRLGMLVPVNGTEVSRRGAEVALTLAQAANVPVTALFVANAAEAASRQRIGSLRRSRDAVLGEIEDIAKRHGVDLRTAARIGVAAEDAILREARLGQHDMIVMGVGRRPGEALAFGLVAESILDASDRTIVFIAS